MDTFCENPSPLSTTYSVQRVDTIDGLWLGAGICLVSLRCFFDITGSQHPSQGSTSSLHCCPQDFTQAWIGTGSIKLCLETKNVAPEDSLGFVASEEVLNYVLLCDSIVCSADLVLYAFVQVLDQSCYVEPAKVRFICGNSWRSPQMSIDPLVRCMAFLYVSTNHKSILGSFPT